MDPQRWHDVFTEAWQALEAEQGGEPRIDPYALEDPGGFFAVATESFFESPAHLRQVLPALYEQLSLFYPGRIRPPESVQKAAQPLPQLLVLAAQGVDFLEQFQGQGDAVPIQGQVLVQAPRG